MKDVVFKTIMIKGESGTSIDRIEKTSSSGVVDTYTIYFDDDKEPYTFEVTNGYSIISIEKTATLGNIDTYTVTLDNGDTYTFEVANGNVANSMTAADETLVAPSMSAVKSYINNVNDIEGMLYCGDFVNVPTSSLFNSDPEIGIPRSSHYGLGWAIPAWLVWTSGKGLKIDKTYTGAFDGLYTPKYHNRNINLSDLGVNKVIVTVEWSKDGDNTIHTSTKLINDVDTNYAYTIVELETNIYLKITSFLGEPTSDDYGGTTRFGLELNGNTIQGDYYIRKIKMEKGELATPFGLNKEQFQALQIFNDFSYTFRSRFTVLGIDTQIVLDTDASGEGLQLVALPSGYVLGNTFILGVKIVAQEDNDFVYFSSDFDGSSYTGNTKAELGYKLREINGDPYIVVRFKDEDLPSVGLGVQILLYKAYDLLF